MWARAPLLLFRFPGVFLAVFGAALVLGLTASSGHLFLSSAGTAALDQAVAGTSQAASGLSLGLTGPIAPDRVRYREQLLREATAGLAGLGGTRTSLIDQSTVELGPSPRPGHFGQGPFAVLATRTGFERHLHVVGKGGGSGWWVPLTVARKLHVHAGQTLHMDVGMVVIGRGFSPLGPAFDLRVAGVYRDLHTLPPTAFWNPVSEYIYPSPQALGEIPPSFLLADEDEFLKVESAFVGSGPMRFEVPVDTGRVTLPTARALAGKLQRLEGQVQDPTSALGAAFAAGTTVLPSLVDEADRTVAGLSAPVDSVALAGRLVALAVVVAAGIYALHRRRVEFSMLLARGVSPLTAGARVALEAVVPTLLGATAGFAAAVWLTRLAGPSDLLTLHAFVAGAVDTAVTLLVALVLLAAAVAVALRAPGERRPGKVRRLASRVPWEALVLVVAGAALYEIETRGVTPLSPGFGASGASARIDPLVPLFPILFVAGLGGLAVRALRGLLPRLRRAARGWPSPLYLAGERLAAAPRPALMLVTASALAAGILVYAGVFVSSVRDTAHEKAEVSVGSDASILLGEATQLPGRLGAPTTEVVSLPVVTVSPATNVAMTTVDTTTFPRAAFWDPGFADRPLRRLMDELAAPAGDAVPIAVIGAHLPPSVTLQFLAATVPARVVGELNGFPGMPAGAPLVVAGTRALERVVAKQGLILDDLQPQYELWVRGSVAPVVRALRQDGIYPATVITAAHVAETPGFLALSWLFGYLEALGALAGLLALVALVLYVESRQRAREVSYALAVRMGLTRAAHLLSVALELLAMLLGAFAIGAVLAAAGSFTVHGKVDPLPQFPPGALFRLPRGLLAILAAAVVVSAAGAALIVQRRADRANVAEVMRLAG
jgi:putative ABC transport system permease protein